MSKSQRIIASGSDFMAFIRSGEEAAYTYKPIAGQNNCTLTDDDDYRESNNKNQGHFKDFFKDIETWTASVDIDIVDNVADPSEDEVSYEELQDYKKAGTKPTFVFAWVDKDCVVDTTRRMYSGECLINAPFAGNKGENATSSVALQGCGELSYIDPV